ncbi:MAG: DUF11 domain-containing protein [Gammaproteobacteria bacterium]|nr:DUF11 domain-containing protein [Gammaproteobacteria bacterium]
MVYCFTDAERAFCAGRKTSALAVLRLWAVFFITLLMAVVLTTKIAHAIPVGTSISNTASTSYIVSGVSGFTENSNTEQFLVEDSGIPDSATLTVTEASGLYFIGGDVVTMTVDVTNSGGNTQAASEIRMSVPAGSVLTLDGNSATSEVTNGATTTYTFNVADISVGDSATYTALLTLATNIDTANDQINTAYFTNGATINTNVITLNLRNRTLSELSLMRLSLDNTITPQVVNLTEYDDGMGDYVPLPVPNMPYTTIAVTSTPMRLEDAAAFSHLQSVFVRVDDFDRNINRLAAETVTVDVSVDGNADMERYRLLETDIDSGVFTGYITISLSTQVAYDGQLSINTNSEITVTYRDLADTSDIAMKEIIVDPYGTLYNSATGVALNGYTVHMVDMNTGLPAAVVGDDGISAYPATVVTGGTVVDASGTVYNFDNGSYRFPFAPVGNYQLIVEPPANVAFRWPSTKTDEALAVTPNGPFVVTLGSRGETFPLQPGPPLHIDIPVDPVDTPLYVTRSANKAEVAVGDFIQFRVEIENLAASVMNDLTLHDELPHGFRIQENSIYIDGVYAPMPIIASNGSTLRFDLGGMAPGASTTIEYVAAVGAVNRNIATSSSYAESGENFALSNTALLETIIIEELMRSRTILMGQVVIDGDGERRGLSGARIFMEDGRYAITDERGMYHFDDVKPGTHILQLDTGGLPSNYEAVMKESNTRFAGNASSQFVDVQGGSLWRSDFYVAEKARTGGYASVQIENMPQEKPEEITYRIKLEAEKVALDKVRLTVVLPDGAAYKPGSSLLGVEVVDDPQVMDNMLIYRLGNSSDAWHESLQYTVTLANENNNDELISKVSMVFNVPSKKGQRVPLATHSLLTRAGNSGQVTSGIKQRVTTFGEKPGSDFVVVDDTREEGLPEYDWEWLGRSNANGEFKWLTPAKGALPAIPSTSVVIKHDQFHRIELSLNGKPVPAPNYEGSMKNKNGASLSIWRGVDLVVGRNLFEATVIDLSDQVLHRFTRIAHFSAPPVRAELVEEQSMLIADGSTNPVIAVRLLDRDGYPARYDVIGRFEINPAYKVQREDDFADLNIPGASLTRHEYRVLHDGIVKIKLEPTTESGDVELNFLLANNIIEEVNAPLRAEVGEWLLVGLAEGSVGYNKLSDNIESLSGIAAEEALYSDGRVAFYGKGRILGRWILTLAYDSDKEKPLQDGDPGLFQQIDPGKYYTIYGDTAYNGFDARSSEKLYLKLERDAFYFLFGDYQTNLDNVDLAQYNRTLTGIKSRYHAGGIDVVVFASESNQAFVKDEIRGESRSGPYYLSRNKIAMNSEVVTIEVRDRFRSEIIVDRREMARHSEYDIDYRAGTITFRESVYSIDAGLNPVFIVVKYESFDQGDDTLTMGGHAEVEMSENTSVGITRIDEGRVGGDAEMDGINVRHNFGDNVQLKVEVARSLDERASGDLVKGNAYIAELAGRNERLDTRGYVREQEAGFGLGQSTGSENGSRKMGVDASLRVTDRLRLKAQLYRQETLDSAATRDLVETNGSYQFDSSSLRLGARSVRDERGNGDKEISDQITAGASKQLWDGRLVARIDREQNISSGKINSSDFPDRTRVGVDYRLTQSSDLFVEHELTDGDLRDTRSTLMGIKSTPWEGGKIYTGLKQSADAKRTTTSANVALQQKWLLNENWSLDVGAEESRTMSDTSVTPLNANVPLASGGSDFSAASVGLTYAPGDWLWTGRLETRDGSTDDSWGVATAVQTTPNQALSTLLSLQYSESERTTGTRSSKTAIRLGTAYRPENSRWILLDKLDLKRDEASGGEFDTESWRIINNFNANFKQNELWQHSLQYGMKTVNEVINSRNYKAFIDLMGVESRYNINAKWDAGVHVNVLSHWDLKQRDYNSGFSVGHTLAKNVWVSVGYNFVGFTDKDFSASRYTSKGVYLKFRVKFDQNSAKEAVQWLKQ